MWGSNLFHVGILLIFMGHFVGLLTPIWVFDFIGISHTFKQWMAIGIGGVAGIACFIGITLLVHRRLFDARIRTTSSFGDIAILLLLYAQLLLGLATIPVSLGHLDGHEMVKFMTWAQGVMTLQPGVSALVADVHPIFKLHLFLGMIDLPCLPVHAAGARVERADLVSRTARLPGGANQATRAEYRFPSGDGPRAIPARRPLRRLGVIAMSCAIHSTMSCRMEKACGSMEYDIPRDVIAREVQHHAASTPAEGWKAAAEVAGRARIIGAGGTAAGHHVRTAGGFRGTTGDRPTRRRPVDSSSKR